MSKPQIHHAQIQHLFRSRSLDEKLPKLSPTLRLKYNGKIDNWGFAIFKWSSESYTTDYFFIPDGEYVNGTIAGALQAAITAYPPRYTSDLAKQHDIFNYLLQQFKNQFGPKKK